MSSYVLRVVLSDQRIVEFRFDPLTDQPLSLTAEAGAVYAVVDAQTHEIIEDVKLKQDGDSLVVEVEEELVARVDDFYATGQQVYFDTGLQTLSGEAQLIASNDASVESSDVVWEHANDDFDAAVGGLGTATLIAGGAMGAATGYLLYNPVDTGVGTPEATVVVFDLVGGVSSSHSGTTFDPSVTYDIYIRAFDDTSTLYTTPQPGSAGLWNTWSGGENLGPDDTIILVGQGGPMFGGSSGSPGFVSVAIGTTTFSPGVTRHSGSTSFLWWGSAYGTVAGLGLWHSSDTVSASFGRVTYSTTAYAVLWTGAGSSVPSLNFSGLPLSQVYNTTMPAGILTSQGLV